MMNRAIGERFLDVVKKVSVGDLGAEDRGWSEFSGSHFWRSKSWAGLGRDSVAGSSGFKVLREEKRPP